MIIEKSLQDFWEIVKNNEFVRAGNTLAICLLIPSGKLNDLVAEDKAKDSIISEGAKIFTCLKEGIFARVSWTTYYGLTQGKLEDVKKIMEEAIKQSSAINKNCGLWQVAVALLGNYEAGRFFGDIAMPIEKSYKPKPK